MILLFKKSIPIHNRLSQQLSKYLKETKIPKWMTMGKTTLIQKGTNPFSYRPIMCLFMMCKILTAQIREDA